MTNNEQLKTWHIIDLVGDGGEAGDDDLDRLEEVVRAWYPDAPEDSGVDETVTHLFLCLRQGYSHLDCERFLGVDVWSDQ